MARVTVVTTADSYSTTVVENVINIMAPVATSPYWSIQYEKEGEACRLWLDPTYVYSIDLEGETEIIEKAQKKQNSTVQLMKDVMD